MSLGVRVTSLQSEQPIEQARVELLRFPDGLVDVAFSDSTGSVLFHSLQANAYIVRAAKSGYRTEEVHVDVRRGDSHRQVNVQLGSEESAAASAPAGTISSRSLSIPGSALSEFRRGAELLSEKKNPKQSIPHFQKAIDVFPGYHEAYFLMGMAHLQMNALNDSRVALAKAVELDPRFLQAYYPLSIVLISLKRYDEAEDVLRRAMETDKDGWQWPFELARCYAAKGQWDKALRYGQIAHDRPNAPTKVHLLMADLYSNQGNKAKAVEELEKFSRLDANSPFMPKVRQALSQLRTP